MSSNITVVVSTPAPITVEFDTEQGQPGPPGERGEQGIQGVAGTAQTFSFTQATPSALWTIVHNLNRFPAIEVADSTGRIVEGDFTYVDANTIQIAFSAPFSGAAYLN